jgi:isoleucyl-tRNA synthetase
MHRGAKIAFWYVRQSRRRFWKSEDKAAAYQTLYEVLVTLAELIAPILPFTAEEIFQNLVRSIHDDAPESVHLCAYPEVNLAWEDAQPVADIATPRCVVSLALSARQQANVKVRQSLSSLLVKPSDARARDVLLRMRDQVLNELNLKQLAFIHAESAFQSFSVKLNLAAFGPKFGKRLPHLQHALSAADAAEIGARAMSGEPVELRMNDESVTLAPDELMVERLPAAGLAVISDDECIVALDTRLSTS